MQTDHSDVILSVECVEPEGTFFRTIKPLIFTPANLTKFWERAKEFHTIYGRELKGPQDLLDLFVYEKDNGELGINGLAWVIDDFVGVFSITDIIYRNGMPYMANAHYSFFDRRHKGRVKLVREMLRYIFKEYGLHKLVVEVPNYAKVSVRKFVTDVGFYYCGKRRYEAPYKDDYFDVNIYDILAKEVIRGSAKD